MHADTRSTKQQEQQESGIIRWVRLTSHQPDTAHMGRAGQEACKKVLPTLESGGEHDHNTDIGCTGKYRNQHVETHHRGRTESLNSP